MARTLATEIRKMQDDGFIFVSLESGRAWFFGTPDDPNGKSKHGGFWLYEDGSRRFPQPVQVALN